MDIDQARDDLRHLLSQIREGKTADPDGLSAKLNPSREQKRRDRVADGLFLFEQGMLGLPVRNADRGNGAGSRPRRGRAVFQDRILNEARWQDWHILKWQRGRAVAYTILRKGRADGELMDFGQGAEVMAAQLGMLRWGMDWLAEETKKTLAETGLTYPRWKFCEYMTNAATAAQAAKIQAVLIKQEAQKHGWL